MAINDVYDNEDREDELNPLETDTQTAEDILEQLSFETVKANIESQIDGSLESERDFLGMLVSKVNTILSSLSDEDMRRQIIDDYSSFCTDLSREIVECYNLGCSLIYDDEENDELLINLYGFFVQNHVTYARTFLCNYIKENQDDIIATLGLSRDSTDVTTSANRKKSSNDSTAIILSNIDSVIDYVMTSAPIEPLDFLNTIDDGDVSVSAIIDYYENNQLTGNFVSQYLNEICDDNCSDEALRVRNDIRVSLYMNQ